MNKKIIKKINYSKKIITTICITLGVLTAIVIAKPEDTKETEAPVSNLDNKKIGWGIKRNDNHMQPDLGATNKKLIDKYNGIAMGNNEKNYIYLTFDSGYEAGYTGKILDTLKENQVPATFFITAHYLNTAEDLVKRMIDEGHIIGNQFPHVLMDILKS